MKVCSEFRRSLFGAGTILALIALSLFMLNLADPGRDVAASTIGQFDAALAEAMPGATDVQTTTIFLPLIERRLPTPNLWFGEYYTNADLSGDPAYATVETRVDHGWGEDAPGGLPKNNFSARWNGYWDFEYGEYTFFVWADDGAKLWLDDQLLLDAWTQGGILHRKKIVIETPGLHHLRLEYVERTGSASIHIRWRRTDLYPQWQGEYFIQPWVEFGKVYDQNDPVVQFDWEYGCPIGLPCDGFSVAWEATPVFVTGTHRIYLYADDGYQLLIDGNKVKEAGWYDGQESGREDESYDLKVSRLKQHQITYNFHDRGSLAEARLWIEDLEQPSWTVQYYNNMTLSGTPVVTKSEPTIFHDWKWSSPRNKVSGNHFSIRWSGQRYFHAGTYRFGLFVDDGVRLWIDGELLIDQWHDGRNEYFAPATYLSTGYHDVIVEYYDNEGEAEIRFWFE